MTRIYTRKGDGGGTGILGGGRLSKSAARIRALGALDETNAALGLVLSGPGLTPEAREIVLRLQHTLFELGAALASPDPRTSRELLESETSWLESVIDGMEARLSPLTRFILPGGGPSGARLHWARTVARRAETLVVEAATIEADTAEESKRTQSSASAAGGTAAAPPEGDRGAMLAWMNRLSDALFVLARLVNQEAGVPERAWQSGGGGSQ